MRSTAPFLFWLLLFYFEHAFGALTLAKSAMKKRGGGDFKPQLCGRVEDFSYFRNSIWVFIFKKFNPSRLKEFF